MTAKMGAIKAIKEFFETDAGTGYKGRKIQVAEFKALSFEDRKELGKLCCEALGVEYEPPVKLKK